MSADLTAENPAALAPDVPFNFDALLLALNDATGDFPHGALASAKAHWEIVGPHMIDSLWRAVREPDAVIDAGSFLHEYAFRLAAEMRDTRAFAPLVAMLRLPREQVEQLIGDGIADCLDRALASTFDGDDTSLREIAADLSIDWILRVAAVNAIAIRVNYSNVT